MSSIVSPRLFWICQSAMQIILRRGFPRNCHRDYSPDMMTLRNSNVLQPPSAQTLLSSSTTHILCPHHRLLSPLPCLRTSHSANEKGTHIRIPAQVLSHPQSMMRTFARLPFRSKENASHTPRKKVAASSMEIPMVSRSRTHSTMDQDQRLQYGKLVPIQRESINHHRQLNLSHQADLPTFRTQHLEATDCR